MWRCTESCEVERAPVRSEAKLRMANELRGQSFQTAINGSQPCEAVLNPAPRR